MLCCHIIMEDEIEVITVRMRFTFMSLVRMKEKIFIVYRCE